MSLANNRMCGMHRVGMYNWEGTYDASGINAIANALRVNASLTKVRRAPACAFSAPTMPLSEFSACKGRR